MEEWFLSIFENRRDRGLNRMVKASADNFVISKRYCWFLIAFFPQKMLWSISSNYWKTIFYPLVRPLYCTVCIFMGFLKWFITNIQILWSIYGAWLETSTKALFDLLSCSWNNIIHVLHSKPKHNFRITDPNLTKSS